MSKKPDGGSYVAKLTARTVGAIKPTGAEFDVRDTDLTGFHVRVTKAGRMIYRYLYRLPDGQRRVMTLGETSAFSSEQARDWAQTVALDVKNGGDPRGRREAWKAAPTFADLWERYEQDRLPNLKASTQRQYRLNWQNHLEAKIGSTKVAELTRSDVASLHSRMGVIKTTGNRTLALLSVMLSFAVEHEIIPVNLAKGLKRFKENRREAVYSDDEFSRIALAVNQEEQWARVAFTLLWITGARHGEVLSAEWSDFDLDGDHPIWRIPADRFKGGRHHAYPLDVDTAELIKAYRADSPVVSPRWLFPKPTGEGHRASLRHPWDRVREAAGIEGKVLHTFRHTFITGLASQGASAIDVMNIAGHKSIATSMRYVQAVDRKRLSAVANEAQASIRAATAKKPKDTVVRLAAPEVAS